MRVIKILFLVCFSSFQIVVGGRWDYSGLSRHNSPNEYIQGYLAAETITQITQSYQSLGIGSENIAERIIDDWNEIILGYRSRSQQIGGVIHEKDAFHHLYKQFIYIYGQALIPSSVLRETLLPILSYSNTNKWVYSNQGVGYLPYQISKVLNVSITSFSHHSPQHRQWILSKEITSNSYRRDWLSRFDVLVLDFPCSTSNDCWVSLKDFTEKSKGKFFIYIGEPKGHCCGNSDMWDFICKNWEIIKVKPVGKGLPGSYTYIFVFGRNIEKEDILEECNENQVCTTQTFSKESFLDTCEQEELCKSTQFYQFFHYCEKMKNEKMKNEKVKTEKVKEKTEKTKSKK